MSVKSLFVPHFKCSWCCCALESVLYVLMDTSALLTEKEVWDQAIHHLIRDTALAVLNINAFLISDMSDELHRHMHKQITQQTAASVAQHQTHSCTNTSRHVLMALTATADAHICSELNKHQCASTNQHAQGWVINLAYVTFNCFNKQ